MFPLFLETRLDYYDVDKNDKMSSLLFSFSLQSCSWGIARAFQQPFLDVFEFSKLFLVP